MKISKIQLYICLSIPFFFFPQERNSHTLFFQAATYGGSVVFQKLAIAHLAVSSTCGVFGFSPTHEFP